MTAHRAGEDVAGSGSVGLPGKASDLGLADNVDAPVDPFDVDRLRSTPMNDFSVEKVLLAVPVRRPSKHEFFRVHPDPAYTLDCFVLERSEEMSSETYWVAPDMLSAVANLTRPVRIFTCVNKNGTAFLWPAKLPTASSSGGRRWADSALLIADHAKTSWVKMSGNKDLGAYDLFKAAGDLGEPAFPPAPLSDLLRLAFAGDRLINSIDHPVLKASRGEL